MRTQRPATPSRRRCNQAPRANRGAGCVSSMRTEVAIDKQGRPRVRAPPSTSTTSVRPPQGYSLWCGQHGGHRGRYGAHAAASRALRAASPSRWFCVSVRYAGRVRKTPWQRPKRGSRASKTRRRAATASSRFRPWLQTLLAAQDRQEVECGQVRRAPAQASAGPADAGGAFFEAQGQRQLPGARPPVFSGRANRLHRAMNRPGPRVAFKSRPIRVIEVPPHDATGHFRVRPRPRRGTPAGRRSRMEGGTRVGVLRIDVVHSRLTRFSRQYCWQSMTSASSSRWTECSRNIRIRLSGPGAIQGAVEGHVQVAGGVLDKLADFFLRSRRPASGWWPGRATVPRKPMAGMAQAR